MNMYKRLLLIMASVVLNSFMSSAIASQDLGEKIAYRLGFIYDSANPKVIKSGDELAREGQLLASDLLACANRKVSKKDDQNCKNGMNKLIALDEIASSVPKYDTMIKDWLKELMNDASAGNLGK